MVWCDHDGILARWYEVFRAEMLGEKNTITQRNVRSSMHSRQGHAEDAPRLEDAAIIERFGLKIY